MFLIQLRLITKLHWKCKSYSVVCALVKLLRTLTSCCYRLKGKTHLNEVYYSPRDECIVEDRKGKSDIKLL